jgi:hypothetical protein
MLSPTHTHNEMAYDKRYGNIYRTRHTNIQTFIQMLSLTHTHNEMTYDKRYDNIYRTRHTNIQTFIQKG